jgi:hypothetical protein
MKNRSLLFANEDFEEDFNEELEQKISRKQQEPWKS